MSNGFDDWVEGRSGWEWLFGDPYSSSMAAARSFCQPWVIDAFLAQERHEKMKREIVATAQFVDDVAGQLHNT